jgi:hypothetical protein
MRIDFHGPRFPRIPFPDFSAYAGIAFWARSSTDHGDIAVAIEDERGAGGLERSVRLSTDWRRIILLFDEFRAGAHPEARLHTQAIGSVHFAGGLVALPADYWIDDLVLLCRGDCPVPPWEMGSPLAPGLDDKSLSWIPGQGSSPELRCAELASLAMAPLTEVPAGPDERLFLRVRIPVDPPPAVPLWGWTIENVRTGERSSPVALDDGWTTVALPIPAPGEYTIRAHTHHPGNAVCGAEVSVRAIPR